MTLVAGSPELPKLQVVIIAVSEFDDDYWRNALLSQQIRSTTKALEDFFTEHFPEAKLHVLKTKDQTTGDSIRHFLRNDLEQFASKTLTLFFVISHGESIETQNPLYTGDLMIVTSNSKRESVRDEAIFVGGDLVDSFNKLAKGSIVLAFIDTCYSGAASSAQLGVQGALQNLLGTRMLLMASSLPTQKAYQASFTQALLEIWKQPSPVTNCTAPFQAPALIREKLGSLVDLGPSDGHARVIIPFYGALCLESFAADNGLVLFYNTSNQPLASQISPVSEFEESFPAANVVLDSEAITLVRLNKVRYLAEVFWDNNRVWQDDVDLTQKSLQFKIVGEITSLSELGSAYRRAADLADSAGAGESDVWHLKKLAYASFVNAKDLVSSNAILNELPAVAIQNDLLAVRGLAFKPPMEVSSKIEVQGAEKVQIAKYLQLAGDFANAANLFEQSAQEALDKDKAVASELATHAYFAYAAANKPAKASSIRKQYGLTLGTCKECPMIEGIALQRERLEAGQEFKAKATEKALAYAPFERFQG